MKTCVYVLVVFLVLGCSAPYHPLSTDQLNARETAAREKMLASKQRMVELKLKIDAGDHSEETFNRFLSARCEYLREEEYVSSTHAPIPCQVKTVVLIGPEAVYSQRAQDQLVRDFKDPAAAQYRNVALSNTDLPVVCGEVNGKNSYGAYVGFKRFYATDTSGFSAVDDGSTRFEEVWSRVCNRQQKAP